MKKKQIYKGIIILVSVIISFIVYFYLNISIYYYVLLYIILLNLMYIVFDIKNIVAAKIIIELFYVFTFIYLITSNSRGLNYIDILIYLFVSILIYFVTIYFCHPLFYKISLYFYNYSIVNFKKENYKKALKFMFIARLFYDCPEFHENKGRIYLFIGQYNKAISQFLKCLKFKEQPIIYEYIAAAYTELNDERKALEYRLKVYSMNKNETKDLKYLDYQTNLWELGRLYFKQNNYLKALMFIKEYIQLCPDDCKAYNAAGYSASEFDKELEYTFYQQAYNCCLKNNTDKDKLITTLWNLALASYDLNKTSATIEYLNELISLQPDNIRAKYDLGKVYFNIQDYQKSLKVFLSIINTKNKYTNKAIIHMALIYKNNNEIEKAGKLIRENNENINLNNEEIKEEFTENKLEELRKFICMN